MRILVPSVAACAAAVMVTTFGLSSSTAAIAVPVNPDISSSPLTDVSADGLDEAGARASSESTSTASNRGLVNVPGLLRADPDASAEHVSAGPLSPQGGAFEAANTGLTDSSGGEGPALGEPSESASETPGESESAESSEPAETDDPVVGSVQEETEDGTTIAAISDAVDVPSGNPSVVGVTYEGDAGVSFEVRQKTGDEWGAWTDLEIENIDEGGNGTEPFIVADAQSVQLRVLGASDAPAETELVLVDPKSSAEDAAAVQENQPVLPPQTGEGDESAAPSEDAAESGAEENAGTAEAPSTDAANAATADGASVQNAAYVPGSSSVENASVKKVDKPSIGSRKSWGANESMRNGSADYAGSVKAAVVHHTAGANGYSADDVPSILRGIYSFHTQGRGWSDVGYNVLADKFGRLWEGRAGGVDKAVIGAHVAGYNTGSFGISVMGTYEKKAPPQKTIDAVNHAIAWKLSADGVSAGDRTTLAGKTIRTVVGHRDLGQTSCPGAAFYSKMGGMRSDIEKMQDGGDTPEDEKDKEKDDKKDKKDDKKKDDEKESKTPIEEKYEGNVEQLGKPSGKEFEVAGGLGQKYAKGHIYYTKATGAHIVKGAIDDLVDEDLLEQIGFPKADQKGGLKDDGHYQPFRKGSVHYTEDAGAHATTGVLQKYWRDKGYENGHLGYPTGELTVKDGRAEQTFQGARLVWAEGYGTTEFSAAGDLDGGVEDLNPRDGGESGEPGEGPSEEPTTEPSAEPSQEPSAEPTTEPTEDSSPEPSRSASPEPTTTPSPEPTKTAEPKPTKTAEPKPSKKPEKTEEQKEEEKRAAIIAEAKKHMGVPYLWGGASSESGWDCSGYTQYVYGKNGIDLPRTTSAQKEAGEVISAEEAKPGDLVWVPGHIGIISETKGQMYDAGSPRTNTSKRSYSWMLDRGAVFIRVI